ncbi:MAG: hypothetical protein RLT05_00335, partial [Bauldia litoralis]
RLTVEENLRMGAFINGARSRFDERLAYVYELFPRMKERRHQLAGTMSGVEQLTSFKYRVRGTGQVRP